jgi:hypothetical protein
MDDDEKLGIHGTTEATVLFVVVAVVDTYSYSSKRYHSCVAMENHRKRYRYDVLKLQTRLAKCRLLPVPVLIPVVRPTTLLL